MNEQQKPQKQERERVPIPVQKLLFTSTNPHGVKLPDGNEGKNERIFPHLMAGIQGEVKIEIDHRPWLRVFHVVKLRRVTQTEKGQEVVSWVPMGEPFHIPDTWAVSVPVAE